MTPDERLTPKRPIGRPRKDSVIRFNEPGTVESEPVMSESEVKKSRVLCKNDPIYVGTQLVGYYYTKDANGIWYKPLKDYDPDLTTCKHMSFAMLESAMGVKLG